MTTEAMTMEAHDQVVSELEAHRTGDCTGENRTDGPSATQSSYPAMFMEAKPTQSSHAAVFMEAKPTQSSYPAVFMEAKPTQSSHAAVFMAAKPTQSSYPAVFMEAQPTQIGSRSRRSSPSATV